MLTYRGSGTDSLPYYVISQETLEHMYTNFSLHLSVASNHMSHSSPIRQDQNNRKGMVKKRLKEAMSQRGFTGRHRLRRKEGSRRSRGEKKRERKKEGKKEDKKQARPSVACSSRYQAVMADHETQFTCNCP